MRGTGRAWWWGALVASLAVACGPRLVTTEIVPPPEKPTEGPKISEEERSGALPELRGIVSERPVVPERLALPKLPPDPTPRFDGGLAPALSPGTPREASPPAPQEVPLVPEPG